MIRIKNSVIQLPAYEVPQKAKIKLNQNESPYDIPLQYKREILHYLKKLSWNRYPSDNAHELKSRLARYTDHSEDGIMLGNGSNELILTILLATCDRADDIMLVTPGFAIYQYFAKILNLHVTEIPLQEDFSFDIDAMVRQSHKSKVIFFASPNNPTGTVMEISAIEQIAKKSRGLVVVDEAYHEFHRLSAQRLIGRYKNLLILRTFSKAFGLAGIRLGYVLGSSSVIRQVGKAKPPFSVGIFQQVVARVMLEKKKFVQETAARIIKERERMFERLNNIAGVKPIPSRANFILFGLNRLSASQLFENLYAKGILVRRFNHPCLKNMLRVTVGTAENNQLFLRSLQGCIRNLEVTNA
ncbi:MAG: histidinol-phosphate transaminase [bacterium]